MTAKPAYERKDPKSKQSGQTRKYIVRPPLVLREIELPSVTSILGALPKPALKLWGEKLVAEAAVEHRAMLTKMEPDKMLAYLRRVPDNVMRARGVRGTKIHAVAENVLRGTHPEENKSPWAGRVARFLDEWVDDIVTVEQVCLHLEDGWAGTTDFIFRNRQGEIVLADWKTSKSIYPDNALQLAAYAMADTWVMNPHTDQVSLAKPLHIDRIAVLHVTEDGVEYHEPDYTIEHLYEVFDAVHTVWKSLRNSATKVKMSVMHEPPRPTVAEYVEHLRARCLHAQSEQPHFREVLKGRWPDGVPTLASGNVDNVHQCERIDICVNSVERDLDITFGAVPHLGYSPGFGQPSMREQSHWRTAALNYERAHERKGDEAFYVVCSCGAEWWLDYDPPACECYGDDEGSRIELRVREMKQGVPS